LLESRYLKDIRAVVFDAVGTLIYPEPAVAAVYAEIGRKHGCAADPSLIRERFAAAFRRQDVIDQQNGLRTSEERERERWRAIVSEVLFDADDPGSCFEELFTHFSKPQNWRVLTEAMSILGHLQEHGLKLYLASNFDSRLRLIASELPGLAAIGHLVISSEIGWRKPAPAFFAAVRETLSEAPDRILFVGDDLVNDYQAAELAGMRAVLLDPNGKRPGIRSLGELCF
jgi:putative hydrolase of the HAD superfamily